MAKEKKTLKFQMMMSPEEAEVLDDWMFKKRIRSRAEAIRRLWQLGMLNDERRIQALSDVIEVGDASSRVVRGTSEWLATADVPDEVKSSLETALANQELQVARLLYDTCKSMIEIFPLIVGLATDEGFKRMRALKEKVDKLDPRNKEDIDELMRMMALLYPKITSGQPSDQVVPEN